MCAFKRFTIKNNIVLKSLFPSNLIFVFIQSVLHPSCSILSSCRYTKSSSFFFFKKSILSNIPHMGVSFNGGFPPISHPKMLIIFARKTHGFVGYPHGLNWPSQAQLRSCCRRSLPLAQRASLSSVVSLGRWELSYELGKVGTGPPNHPILIGFSITNHPVWGCFPYCWKQTMWIVVLTIYICIYIHILSNKLL